MYLQKESLEYRTHFKAIFIHCFPDQSSRPFSYLIGKTFNKESFLVKNLA